MAEENNKIPDSSHEKPKNLHLGEDFEIWMKGTKEQKEFLETKTHIDAQSQLADLRESFGQKTFEKGHHNSSEIHTPHAAPQNNSYVSFETVQTRKEGDKNKNIFQGATESIYVPFRAVKDVFVDAAKMAFSPIQETKRTLAYLEKESSAKII